MVIQVSDYQTYEVLYESSKSKRARACREIRI